MRKKLILTIILILLLPLISASENCFQEACADLDLPGGNGFTGFGSNVANLITNVSGYTSCTIEGSDYTPVTTDTDGDLSSDIFTIQNGVIKLYDSLCNQIRQVTLTSGVRAMPVLVESFDTDNGVDEYVLLRNETLEFYEININGSTLVRNISYVASGGFNLDFIACTRETNACLGFREGHSNVTVFNITAETVTLRTNETTKPIETFPGVHRFGLSSTVVTQPIFINCLMSVAPASLVCDQYLDNGLNVNVASFSDPVTGTMTSMRKQDTFIARVNGVDRILLSGTFDASGTKYNYMKAATMTGAVLIAEEGGGASVANYSNWVVADFEKTGQSSACVLRRRLGVGDLVIRCYDSTFTSNTTWILRNGTHRGAGMNFSHGIVLADFNGSAPTLGIATVEGIFYPDHDTPSNGSGSTSLFLSGFKSRGADRPGNVVLIQSDSGSGSPGYVYTDDTIGFIVTNPFLGASCGNGVCQIFENDFSCPEDCAGELTPGTCNVDANCPAGYPTCFNNRCVVIDGANQSCNFNSDCPFNNPICFNSRCIRGISGDLPDSVDNVTAAQQDIDSAIESTIGQILGTSALFRFIIGIAITIGIMVAVAQILPNPTIVGIIGVLMLIVMTVLNLVPAFVLILFILGGAGILFFQHQISGRAGGGG